MVCGLAVVLEVVVASVFLGVAAIVLKVVVGCRVVVARVVVVRGETHFPPTLLGTVPDGHGRHADLSGFEMVPGPQGMHFVRLASGVCPTLQNEQLGEFVFVLIRPGRHGRQFLPKNPAGHAVVVVVEVVTGSVELVVVVRGGLTVVVTAAVVVALVGRVVVLGRVGRSMQAVRRALLIIPLGHLLQLLAPARGFTSPIGQGRQSIPPLPKNPDEHLTIHAVLLALDTRLGGHFRHCRAPA